MKAIEDRKVDHEAMAKRFAKALEEKRMILDQIASGKSLSELEEKGISFVKPISL